MASHLVLLGIPRDLHIPYFAMAVPRSRESYIERLDVGTELARLVGRRCAAWVQKRAQGERIELIATRNYIPSQTAFYASWLLFRDQVAAEFLTSYPQHRLDDRIAKLEADREELAAKLEYRVKRGDFNLGRIGDERPRVDLARGYVESAEAQRSLSSDLKLLERARELAPQWQER